MSGGQASGGEHLTASADRSPQDKLSVIDMSGNEQSLLSILPFNCMKCVCRDDDVLRTLCLFSILVNIKVNLFSSISHILINTFT